MLLALLVIPNKLKHNILNIILFKTIIIYFKKQTVLPILH